MEPVKNPFEIKPYGGGNCAIFTEIGCIGDSLSSGEIEVYKNGERNCIDIYEYSWGQFMARMLGVKVYNFSRGGMSAKEFMSGWGEENGCFDKEKRCKAYIIALGFNDLTWIGQQIGNIEDTGTDKDTFARWYSEIIKKYKQIEPNAKFFFVTMPKVFDDSEKDKEMKKNHAALMYEMADKFNNAYVLDFYKYAPLYDEDFKKKYYLNGHMTAAGYRLTAEYMISAVHNVVSENLRDFDDVPFIGTGYHELFEK